MKDPGGPSATAASRARPTIVLLALLFVVAAMVISAGQRPGRATRIPIPNLGDALAILWLFAVLYGVFWIIRSASLKPRAGVRNRRNRGDLVAWTGLLLLALLISQRGDLGEQLAELVAEQREETQLGEVGASQADEPAPEPPSLLTVAISLALLAALAGYVSRKKLRTTPVAPLRTGPPAAEPDAVPATHQAIRAASERLANERDPRLAVLVAYAELEAVLATVDQGRTATETHREHLARVSGTVHVRREPLVAFGALYERARYSKATVDETHRDQAAVWLTDALAQIEANDGTVPAES